MTVCTVSFEPLQACATNKVKNNVIAIPINNHFLENLCFSRWTLEPKSTFFSSSTKHVCLRPYLRPIFFFIYKLLQPIEIPNVLLSLPRLAKDYSRFITSCLLYRLKL